MIKNFDDLWWKIESSDMNTDIIVSDRILSVSVTETMGQMDTCQISMLDPNLLYSRIFRNGVTFKLDWGTVSDKRGAIEFLVNSPSGSADANGKIVYNMSGQAMGDMLPKRKYYDSGTKGSVVRDACDRLGCINIEVDFERMSEIVNDENKIAQWESDFRFLARLAEEYRCVFRVGYSKMGTKCAIFCEPSKLQNHLFSRIIALDSLHLEYGGGLANVEKYSWKDQSANASQGTSVQVRIIDGQVQFYRYIAEDQKIVSYRLNEEAVRAEYDEQETFSDKSSFVRDVLSAKSFEEVKRFFIEDTITSSPQGSGMTVNVHMFGDINVTAGQQVTFGQGFPDRIGASDSHWYVKSVTHSMSSSGYFCDLEIVDAYAITPTGEKL